MGNEPEIAWHTLSTQETLKSVGSSDQGLSSGDAAKRLAEHGLNELTKEKGESPIMLFINQFKNFLVIILIVAAVFSIAIGEVLDASVILIIVVLNSVFGFVQEYRAGKAIEALKKLTSPESVVMRDGQKMKIPSNQLVPGDIVFLEEGSKIPADMRLLETINLRIDESSLTGESVPVGKQTEAMGEVILADRKNMAYMGTHVTYGHGEGIIIATGMATEIGKIAHMISESEEEDTPLQQKLEVFSKHLGFLILGICAVVTIVGVFDQKPVLDMILTGISLAVAAIPEGLPAVVTITLALGLQRLSKKNALMRTLPATETLGSTSVICSDKTGTLTKNEMTVRKIWYAGKSVDVTGDGYAPQGQFMRDGKPAQLDTHLRLLLRTGALCNNAALSGEKMIGDPTEGAILVAAAKGMETPKEYRRIKEIPFSSERKLMSTINMVGTKKVMFMKGAPEVVMKQCSSVLIDGETQKFTGERQEEVLKINQDMSAQALRVLGFAYKEGGSESEEEMTFLGLMGMIDPPRESVKGDIKACRTAGIKVVMITGDHKNTAVAIAKEIGMYEDKDIALTGEELEMLDPTFFESVVERVAVYARVNPADKQRIVTAFKKKGHIVAMTGDGVNDAPALKKADIGVAMGINGTDVAKEAADMILTDDNFSSIVSAVREGRGIFDNISNFILYLLSSNMAEVLVVFLALFMFRESDTVLLPLMAVHLLWINLVTDGFPALALGVDPPKEGIMQQPPRQAKVNFLNPKNLTFILGVGILITAGTLWVFATELPHGLAKAQTMAFATIVMYEMFNVFNSRGFIRRKWFGLVDNWKLMVAIGLSIFLQVLVISWPPLQSAFDTVPLSLEDWTKVLLVSLTVLLWGIKEWWDTRR